MPPAVRAAAGALAILLQAAAAACGQPTPAGAAGSPWFPTAPAFAPLLAAPREVGLRGSFVAADRPEADFRGRNVEAEVAIGHGIPVLLAAAESDGGAEAVLGFEVGIFSRFFMASAEKDLINTDFRVGAPISVRHGGWEGRLTLLHVSSHLGDDFLQRFPRPPTQVTRDGVEVLVARRLGPLRLYGGADLNFHVNPGVERVAGRGGVEWEPGRHGGSPARPYAALDLQVAEENRRLAGTAVAGVAFAPGEVGVRVEGRAHFGPSPLGQLRDRDESFLGVGLRVEP